MYSSMYLHMFCCTTCFVQWVEGYLVACMSHYIVDPTRPCDPCTVCIGYKVIGCKNIAVITMEFQKITIKTCFSIVKISGKTISAIAIYRV